VPILTDFGIARLQGAVTTTMTRAGIGTPLYISPEQAKGQAANERSDLYSLGIILYEILTGVTPYRGDSPLVIMMQQLQEMPTPPALINPAISPALSAVVLQSIAKDPQERFPSASAMTLAIAEALGVPAPTSLSKSRIVNEQTEYNPLQPDAPLQGMVPHPPALTPSSPAQFTPASAGYPEALLNSPPYLTPGTTESQFPGIGGFNSPQVDHQLQPAPVSPPAMPAPRTRRKALYIALIACVLVLLVGISAFVVPSLLSSKNGTPTQNTSASVVGQIIFSSSPNAANNHTYDQLQITLNNIPSPPAGQKYYAWLENSNSEAQVVPHWALQVSNGTVDGHFIAANHADLLDGNTKFLVTEEDASATPVIPFPDPNTHLYYAVISRTSTSSPTFDVKQCPAAGTAGNPCS
jgi:serine/threonine protein kinase